MEKKYYVTQTNLDSGEIFYKRYKTTYGWVYPKWKCLCWKFSKHGAENIAERLQERAEANRVYTLKYGVEEVAE